MRRNRLRDLLIARREFEVGLRQLLAAVCKFQVGLPRRRVFCVRPSFALLGCTPQQIGGLSVYRGTSVPRSPSRERFPARSCGADVLGGRCSPCSCSAGLGDFFSTATKLSFRACSRSRRAQRLHFHKIAKPRLSMMPALHKNSLNSATSSRTPTVSTTSCAIKDRRSRARAHVKVK